jgi:hypothetical protein
MKHLLMRFGAAVVGAAMVLLMVSGGTKGYAATITNVGGSATEYLDPEGDYSRLTEAEALKMAYQVLQDANHNYNKHRVKAMAEISAAAKAVGLDLQGSGPGHEDQDVSDARFHLARRLVEQVRSRLAAGAPEAERAHIDAALKEIAKGLEIRAVEDQ